MLSYVARHLGLFFSGIFFLAVEAGADLLQPAYMAAIVDRGVKGGSAEEILRCGLTMLAIAAAGALGAVARNALSAYTSQRISCEMRSDLYRKIQLLSLENIDRLGPAGIITRITNDVTQIASFINGCMRVLVKAPMTCVGAICLIALQSPRQIPVVLAVVVAAVALIAVNMKLGYPRFAALQKKLDALNAVSREFLAGIRLVKSFGAEEHEARRFEGASAELSRASAETMQVAAFFLPLINLTVNFGIVAILWRARYSGGAGVGRLMASLNYMTQMLFSLAMFSSILNRAVRATVSANRIAEVLSTESAQKSATHPVHPEWNGEVEFRDVSFAYAGGAKNAVENVSFSAREGEFLGIIGPTGAGKSALVNLIPRFYDATSGTVCVSGADVTKVSERDLRAVVAISPQKSLLFSGTILQNLTMGKPDATDEEISRACKTSCADEFISALPQKLNTVLGQGGVNLSGGQKQRLALARALLRNPKILILDDCTSALDALTEAKVFSALRRELSGVTVFLVSQRISAVRDCDRILCMEAGQLCGNGTHEQLMRDCDAYRAIYRSQIGGGENA